MPTTESKRSQLDRLSARILTPDAGNTTSVHPDTTTLSMWVSQGDGRGGVVMCVDCMMPFKDGFCAEDDCYGCPRAWRVKDGKIEYWKKPEHRYVGA